VRKVGFTGTQRGMTVQQRHAFYDELGRGPGEFHHGDCVGSDATAHVIATHLGWEPHVHPPIDERKRAFSIGGVLYTPLQYLDRNRAIVNLCDVLYATPAGPEVLKSGTWATVRYARRSGLQIVIIWPDGTITRENSK
jgi:hypothetical protein